MCTYLHKAPNGVYYFRMGIPAELRPRFGGRREIKHSLRTKDRDEAKKLIPDETKAANALLEQARGIAPQPPASAPRKSPPQLERERKRWEHEQEQGAFLSAEIDRLDFENEELVGVMDALKAGQVPLASPAEVVRAAQLAISHERQMADIRLQEQAASRMARYTPKQQPEAPEEKLTDAAPGDLLEPGLFDQWQAEGSKRPKTIAMVKKTAEWFQDRVGKVPFREITKAHVLDFKRKLQAEGHSVANINVRLSHISLLLGWAARNDLVPINVAKDTQIPNPQAKKNRRKPFDLPALKAIFSSPVFATGERPARGRGEAAYWLPVLALYTGARVRELAQLRHSDVREVEYPDAAGVLQKDWFINITEDTDETGLANAIKNAGSERLVPVHPFLIEQGFIAYVRGIGNKQGRIFPQLTEDIYGNPAAKWGEWFGKYLRKVCNVADTRMTFHSFRHSFKDNARNSMIPDGLQRQIMGHEGGDVAEQYGSGFALYVVVDAMRHYRVPGLEIPRPL